MITLLNVLEVYLFLLSWLWAFDLHWQFDIFPVLWLFIVRDTTWGTYFLVLGSVAEVLLVSGLLWMHYGRPALLHLPQTRAAGNDFSRSCRRKRPAAALSWRVAVLPHALAHSPAQASQCLIKHGNDAIWTVWSDPSWKLTSLFLVLDMSALHSGSRT